MNIVRVSWKDGMVKIHIDMPGWFFMAIVTAQRRAQQIGAPLDIARPRRARAVLLGIVVLFTPPMLHLGGFLPEGWWSFYFSECAIGVALWLLLDLGLQWSRR